MREENEKAYGDMLDALSEAAGAELKREEGSNRALLMLDEKIPVVLTVADEEEVGVDTVSVLCLLGYAPEDDTGLMRRFLAANYLGAATGGGTLAFDEDNHLTVLWRTFEMPVDPAVFVEEFASLAGAARVWYEELETHTADSDLPENGGKPFDFMQV